MLMVCSGNTCRSPLAAALLARSIEARGDLPLVKVASAGTSAWEGAPASEGSYLVGLELGLDLGGHRARLLTRELIDDADLILTMTEAHLGRVAELGGGDRAATIAGYAGASGADGDIPDPFGGEVAGYRVAAERIAVLVEPVVQRIRVETGR